MKTYMTGKLSVVAIALLLSGSVSAVLRSAADLKKALMVAHSAAFGNKENVLSQRLAADDKQFWNKTLSEVQEFVSAIETKKSILPSKEKNAQQEAKRILVTSMDRLMRVNVDLLNTIAEAYGKLALGLPTQKKQTGTRTLKDIDPKKLDMRFMANLINPISAQKLVAIDVQDKIKQLPVTTNTRLKEGAELVERLALLLETTINFTINSYKKLAEYVKAS